LKIISRIKAPTTLAMVKEREEEKHPFKLGEVYQGIAPCGTT